jgi:UDP-3-O-[3-hydroxymyristoyl] glucosamine N-acyltransferase
MPVSIHYTLGELAARLGCRLQGDAAIVVSGLGSLDAAVAGELTFLANRKFSAQLASTQATAVILHPEFATAATLPCLVTEQPYLVFARASQLFDATPKPCAGIHPTAFVAADADVDASASIGPHCTIEEGAVIGAGVVLGAGCVVGAYSRIGAGSRLYANVSVYHAVVIGERAIIHSGAVIGADGFGFAPNGRTWEKIAQLGGVRIGNDVEIGANSTVDRGAIDDTVIEDGVKIDNLVMVAHNCHIGKNSALAGCVGIAGSTIVGQNCTLGGGVGLSGHLTLADNVHLTGMTLVTGSIDKAGSYSSGTGTMETAEWRKSAVRFSQLDKLNKRVSVLEKQAALEKLTQKN